VDFYDIYFASVTKIDVALCVYIFLDSMRFVLVISGLWLTFFWRRCRHWVSVY